MSSESLPTVGGLSTWRRYPTPISSRPRWPGLSGSDLQPALYLPRPSHGPSPKRSFCWFLTIVNTSSTRQRRWPKHSYDCVQSGEALTLIDEAIGMVEENGDLLYMAEALRVKGNVLLSLPQHRPDDAEMLHPVARLESAPRRAIMGVAHCDRVGGAVGGSGATGSCERYFAIDIRTVCGRLGYN